ncbi:tautomerase family protein [Ruficoccus sp. ZRK36]|uniref:tautomerase family protein n=1 Tax=Ruficoccus sp. ZRK36 TaxID=2866311 RepID=UPI001C72D64D|nr:tautomerase family protein [Ruficoccus sp. ZRK36]QYY35042.1 tautomerase family protein [Ruficoccus sp. ZRK36]
MPHIVIKAVTGKTEEQKQQLADAITRDVMEIFHYGEESVSVAIEEFPAERWKEDVYQADIQAYAERLYKKPGYEL